MNGSFVEYSPTPENGLTAYEQSRERVAAALNAETLGQSELEVIATELYNRRTEDLRPLSAEQQAAKLAGSVGEILPAAELVERLADSKATHEPLKVKYGIDPTGAEVHLGHAVPMLILNRLQRMGHDITFIVGDATAKIGDPSGRVASRPVLTDEKIAENMATYSEQVRSLFDMDNIRVAYNSTWLNNFPTMELVAISMKIPLSAVLQRRDFQQRRDSGSGISQGELLYPTIMALDSVETESDIEVGGKDQFLNLQMCRRVMEICGKRPEVIITTDILEGTDGTGDGTGNKMSKSLGNYVPLTQKPDKMFGQIMSIPDALLGQYYKMLTELEPDEWQQMQARMETGGLHPMEAKKLLAADIVSALHDPEAAQTGRTHFEQQFSAHDYESVADTLPTIDPEQDIIEQLRAARGGESRSEIRRLLGQSAIKLISETGETTQPHDFDELNASIGPNTKYVKIGKKTLLRVNQS